MKTYNYPEINNHKKEHVDLMEQLYVLKNKTGHGHTPFDKDYMQLLRTWLKVHLFDADDNLEEFLHQVYADSDNR